MRNNTRTSTRHAKQVSAYNGEKLSWHLYLDIHTESAQEASREPSSYFYPLVGLALALALVCPEVLKSLMPSSPARAQGQTLVDVVLQALAM